MELNNNIKEYFNGNLVKKKPKIKRKSSNVPLTLDTKLLECGFCFNQKFRDFFSKQTGVKNFKFNTDMVATAKKVREDKDENVSLQDMLDIYYGKKVYAKNDNSACQWNQFLKDFCKDERSNQYANKLKIASILWKEVRNSTKEKVYTKDLLDIYQDKIKEE